MRRSARLLLVLGVLAAVAGFAKVQMWRTTASKPNGRQHAGLLVSGSALVVTAAGVRAPAIPLTAAAISSSARDQLQ